MLEDRAMPNSMTEPKFKVKRLKDGSACQVIMDPQEHAPELLIGDFPNEAEAKEWIKKDSAAWVARRKN
jgi:hypothetical protein